jgi:tRNA-specific 2-thiouridylase
LEHYTIGQRRGLEISAGEPLYVTAIDPARNAVILGNKNDLQKAEFSASKMNWIAIPELSRPAVFTAKIRSAHRGAEAWVSPNSDGSVQVKFNEPQMAVSPGQVVVFYQGDSVVGGGIID